MKLAVILFFSVLLAIITICSADSAHPQSSAIHAQHSVREASGRDNKDNKNIQHKEVKKTEKKSVHDEEKAQKGESLKEIHKKDDTEIGGKKKQQFSQGDHKSSKKSEGASEDGAKFREAAKQKKLKYKKGFREVYHKDEQKKHDSFFSNNHKGGSYEIFDSKHSKFASKHLGKKHHGSSRIGKSVNGHNKKMIKQGGHNAAGQQGHKDEKTIRSYHEHKDKWGKKTGKKDGKQYKYKILHH